MTVPIENAPELISDEAAVEDAYIKKEQQIAVHRACLLYTSDAADDLLCVDLGGRRIIKKKKHIHRPHCI